MSTPLLSIVVPTRERADVLVDTLAALLELKMQDVEFIICDNASTDSTPQVVAGFSDSRIKYSRSDARISMPENFERGLRLATGKYIMTMGDDDFVIEENLELALFRAERDNCDLVYWFRGCFYWGNYPNPALASSFSIPLGRGHFFVEPVTLLNISYLGFVQYQYMPGVYNSLCNRVFLKRYHDFLRGEYFPKYTISLDLFSALVFCALSPSTLYQESPAIVSGISYRSNGMSIYNGGSEASRFTQELGLGEKEFMMPEDFKKCVAPITPTGLNELALLADYFSVGNKLLPYSSLSAPSLDNLAKVHLRRLLSGGHITIDKESDIYKRFISADELEPIVQEDLATYFFKLWSIPFPQMYTGKFESKEITVRHLVAHLTSIGFNKAPPSQT
jgi:hypothetical protein